MNVKEEGSCSEWETWLGRKAISHGNGWSSPNPRLGPFHGGLEEGCVC